jgi:hypothetical protein
MKLTIDKTKYQAIIEQADFTEGNVSDLEVLTQAVGNPYESEFTGIYATFDDIRIWANGKIAEANQEEVMTGFLSELKVVFDKYAAVLEVGSSESGYGSSYGTGETVGIKLTAVLDDVTATKEINKAVIVGSDLV